jgi:hypothetical protein
MERPAVWNGTNYIIEIPPQAVTLSIICRATDEQGNTATENRILDVEDGTPPSITQTCIRMDGNRVLFHVECSDNREIGEVTVEIEKEGRIIVNRSLEENGNGSYTLLIDSDSIEGRISCIFLVYDDSRNVARTGSSVFDVREKKEGNYLTVILFLLIILTILIGMISWRFGIWNYIPGFGKKDR